MTEDGDGEGDYFCRCAPSKRQVEGGNPSLLSCYLMINHVLKVSTIAPNQSRKISWDFHQKIPPPA